MTTRYLRGDAIDEIFARIGAPGGASEVNWLLQDRLGSVREVRDSTGGHLAAVEHDAFGNLIGDAPTALGRYEWTGREYDLEIEMQYNRARYYDPKTGRWLTQDPLGFDAGDSNLCRYVNNGPTNGTDPSGLQGNDIRVTAVRGVDVNDRPTNDMAGPYVTGWFARDIVAHIEFRKEVLDTGKKLGKNPNYEQAHYILLHAPFLMASKWVDFESPRAGFPKGMGVNTVTLVNLPIRKNQLGNIVFGIVSHLYPMEGWTGDRILTKAWNAVAQTYEPDHPHSENYGPFKGVQRADNLAAFGVGHAIAEKIRELPSFKKDGVPTIKEVRDILDELFADKKALADAVRRHEKEIGETARITLDTLTFVPEFRGFNTAALRLPLKSDVFDPPPAKGERPETKTSAGIFLNEIFLAYVKDSKNNIDAFNWRYFATVPWNLEGGLYPLVKEPAWVQLSEWLKRNRENYLNSKGFAK